MPDQLQIPITIEVNTWQSRYEASNDSFREQGTGANQEPNRTLIGSNTKRLPTSGAMANFCRFKSISVS
jgi:hypothetical protein